MILTAALYLNLGEDECPDSFPSKELIASLAEDFRNAVEGNEDSDHELQQMSPGRHYSPGHTFYGLGESNLHDWNDVTEIFRKKH